MKATKLLYSFYILFLLVFTIFIGVKPYYNMDMVPYMAIVLKMDGKLSNEQVHKSTYRKVKEKVSAGEFEDLTFGTGYRETLYSNEKSFNEQLSFYVIKPIYLLFAFLFYKAGISLSFSTVLPSLIAYFLIGLFVLKWVSKIIPSPWLVVWVCLFIITAQPFVSLGKSSTPDALSTLFLLGGCYLFIEKKSLWGSTAFFILSILTRPDYIILVFFIFLIALVGRWKEKVPVGKILLCFFLFFVSYGIPKLFLKEVAWSTLFYHAFISRVLFPLSDPQSLSIGAYLSVIADNIVHRTYFARTYLLWILLFAGLTFFEKVRSRSFGLKAWTLNQAFMLAIISTVIVRFFLFPTFLDRFLAPFLLLSAIIFLKETYPWIRRKGNVKNKPVPLNLSQSQQVTHTPGNGAKPKKSREYSSGK